MKAVPIALTLIAGCCVDAAAALTVHDRIEAISLAARAATLTDPSQALTKAGVIHRLAVMERGHLHVIDLATADWLEAEANLRLNKPLAALPAAKSAEARLSQIDDTSKLRGDVLVTLGWQAMQSGQAALALMRYQEAYEIFQRDHEDRSRARTLVAIAILYDEAFDYSAALKYYKQAQEAAAADAALTLSISGNIGQVFKDLHLYPEAITETHRALVMAYSTHNQIVIGRVSSNLAKIELLAGELSAADDDIRKASRLIKVNDPDYGDLLSIAAQAAFQHGRDALALSLVSRSFNEVDTQHTPLSMRERHQTAYDIYNAVGDSPHALIHLAAMKRLDDEATRLATSTNTALMGARFDFANQELRIAKMKAEETARTLAFERAQARTQSWVFIALISVSAVAIALLMLGLRKLRRSRNEVSRTNVVLGQTNSALGEALAAKTEFLATTSHEIRTPLNGILGMTQVMLADERMDAATRERIGIVHAAGITMRALVNDILDVAKMETGHLTIEQVPIDLRATLEEIVKLWRQQTEAKGLAFEADLTDCPAYVEGDPARLRQVVVNLLSNAIKFTEAGSVSLRASRVAGDPPRYRIAVTDSGIGVAADKREVIFEAFRQGDTSTTRRFGGTGLGLAISRRLARAMGGDVIMTGAAGTGSGSVFVLDLPLIEAAPIAVISPTPGAALLVIERNPIARGMFKALLGPRFGEIACAASATEAAALIDAGGVAWVLADDAALRAEGPLDRQLTIVATAARRRQVPVALLWSARHDEDGDRIVRLGVQQILAKPIARNVFAQQLFSNMDQSATCLESQAA